MRLLCNEHKWDKLPGVPHKGALHDDELPGEVRFSALAPVVRKLCN